MPENHNHMGDLSKLSEEEKLALIESLHNSLHIALDELMSMCWSMDYIGSLLLDGDKFGSRKKTINIAALKLKVIAAMVRASYGITQEDVNVTDEFSEIVAQLDGDPSFMAESEAALDEEDPPRG